MIPGGEGWIDDGGKVPAIMPLPEGARTPYRHDDRGLSGCSGRRVTGDLQVQDEK